VAPEEEVTEVVDDSLISGGVEREAAEDRDGDVVTDSFLESAFETPREW
jgi:hypothetical protein